MINMKGDGFINPKERVYAAIEGKPLDIWPVTAPYTMLSNADHWEELTGLPVYKYYEWQNTTDMNWYREIYKTIYDQQPFDIVQPDFASSLAQRKNRTVEIVVRDGTAYFHNKEKDTLTPVPTNTHNTGSGGGENETRYIFNKADACQRLKLVKAEKMLEDGANCSCDELIKLYGSSRFVVIGGVVNTFYSNSFHVGMTNLYIMLHEEPQLIKYISELLLEQNIEHIRAFAAADGDAIYIDDATATCDMISRQMYEEFSLPYIKQQVKEIQQLGKKAILIYFGGIADRIDLIASTGADMLMMECSMKGYVNDYAKTYPQLNGMCLAGNLNPYEDIEITSDCELEKRIQNMIKMGERYGKYITSTGSPITPKTSLKRIQKYIELAHSPLSQ